MLTIFSNVHEGFQCLEQTSILNGYNLDGKKNILSLIFIFIFENLPTFVLFFCHILGLGFE
jgi:hypothetical protein